MSEKIKIVLKPVVPSSFHNADQQLEKIKLKPKEIQPDPQPTLENNCENLDHDSYLKQFFIKPLKKLIKNEGVHDGALIAQVCALEIMERMFDSLLNRDQTSITDILYEAAFADYSIEEDVEDTEDVEEEEAEEIVEEVEEVSNKVEDSYEEEVEEVSNKVEDSYEEEVDDEDEDEDEDEEEEEDEEITDDYDYESDMEEARECESYMGEYEDESMDG